MSMTVKDIVIEKIIPAFIEGCNEGLLISVVILVILFLMCF